MNWRTTAITLPGWLEDSSLPAESEELGSFEHYARDVALDIEIGGAVELQRIGVAGSWETFETVTEAADLVIVANRPAIRFSPVDNCVFRVVWKQ